MGRCCWWCWLLACHRRPRDSRGSLRWLLRNTRHTQRWGRMIPSNRSRNTKKKAWTRMRMWMWAVSAVPSAGRSCHTPLAVRSDTTDRTIRIAAGTSVSPPKKRRTVAVVVAAAVVGAVGSSRPRGHCCRIAGGASVALFARVLLRTTRRKGGGTGPKRPFAGPCCGMQKRDRRCPDPCPLPSHDGTQPDLMT